VNAEAKTEEWRAKYLDSVSKLEGEQQRFRDLEAALKRLTGRLCIATLGLSPRLDAQVKKLQAMMKRDASKEELEQLMTPLTDAIHSLDEKTTAPVEVTTASSTPTLSPSASSPTAPSSAEAVVSVTSATNDTAPTYIANESQLRATLSTLLTELKRDTAMVLQVEMLDDKLSEPLTIDSLSSVMSALTGMVGRRIQRIDQARAEAESLLAQMLARLDEMTHFVADQNQNQKQALASSESLNAQLTGEMQAMGESVESASDLTQMRTLVRGRLEAIGKHLRDFRQRENERARTMQEKQEQMQARVTQLEAEAQKLQAQVKEEQQASLIDALTKAPNRLAYDKRIAEELERWQRFSHPTCIAAWDIDHFKRINDSYGHRAGDRVLQVVADCLKEHTRSTDFFGRYGGEEFAMIFAGASIEQVLKLTNDIRIAIGQLGFHFRGTRVSITASCGITSFQKGDTVGSAFERADAALYKAKNEGRNRCVAG
jgi:diguanylate cyclase